MGGKNAKVRRHRPARAGNAQPPHVRGPVTRNAAQPAGRATTQKLHKVLAQAGYGSRRDMELWIRDGKVMVNGVLAKLGLRVGERDQITVAGSVVETGSAARLPRVLLYHKPDGEIVSRDDPRRRPSVFEHLPVVKHAKWIAVGRLDFNTCGLLIFTTSGELANQMMHPRFEIEREYAVRVMGRLQPQHLQQLTQGIELEDGIARCERVELRGGQGANQWCHVVLKEGRNRVVRRMFGKLGLTVSRLMRVRFGMLELPPRVKRGHYQELSSEQTRRLLEWLAAAPRASSPAPRQRGADRGDSA